MCELACALYRVAERFAEWPCVVRRGWWRVAGASSTVESPSSQRDWFWTSTSPLPSGAAHAGRLHYDCVLGSRMQTSPKTLRPTWRPNPKIKYCIHGDGRAARVGGVQCGVNSCVVVWSGCVSREGTSDMDCGSPRLKHTTSTRNCFRRRVWGAEIAQYK